MIGGLEENAIMIPEDPRLELIRKGFSPSAQEGFFNKKFSRRISVEVCLNFGSPTLKVVCTSKYPYNFLQMLILTSAKHPCTKQPNGKCQRSHPLP